MPNSRVTDAGIYIEINGEWVRITDTGLYVEMMRRWARVTDAGLYAELGGEWARITNAGVYIELAIPPNYIYSIGIGHNVALGELAGITPQPSSPGVMYTRRLPSGEGGVDDSGPFVPLEWNVLYNGAAYQALLSQFGLDAAKVVAVTVLARDEVWNWARFNGYAIQPLPGEDIAYERFFPQGLTILVTDLELIEVYE